nr:DUF134 domain-containing protein [Maliibacterium massiliense]
MARPRKQRRVCGMPRCDRFEAQMPGGAHVHMRVDEFEAIRLIDHEALTQQQCAERMGVARPTVQRIYEQARKKLADFLVEGGALSIHGGDYALCDAPAPGQGADATAAQRQEPPAPARPDIFLALPVMRQSEDALLAPSLRRAPYLMLYDAAHETCVYLQNGDAQVRGGGVKAARRVVESGATALIVPHLGERASQMLETAGVAVCAATPGNAAENIARYLAEEA